MHARLGLGVPRRRPLFTALACCALILVGLAPSAFSQTWEIEVVVVGRSFTAGNDRSLQLDSEGHVHVAYGGQTLYYACFDGTEWLCEVADPTAGVGANANLVLDAAGDPHISYYNATNHRLKYARRGPKPAFPLEDVLADGALQLT